MHRASGFVPPKLESSMKIGCGPSKALASLTERFTSPWGDKETGHEQIDRGTA